MSKSSTKKNIEKEEKSQTSKKFQVKDVSVEKKTLDTKELEKFAILIKKHNLHPDPMSLLPNAPQEEVRFTLSGTHAGFANCVRRTLVNEIDCLTLTCTHASIKTDDPYLANKTDKIIDDLGSIICNQHLTEDQIKKLDEGVLFILKANTTEAPIHITVNDIYYMKKEDFKKHYSMNKKAYEELTGFETKKGGASVDSDFLEKQKINTNNYGSFKIPEHVKLLAYQNNEKSSMNLDFLFPVKTQIISRLIRDKTLFVTDIKLIKGRGFQNAQRFTLLDEVYYKPVDVIPYDMYEQDGSNNKRTIQVSPSEFEIGFLTRCGNIKANHVMNLCCASITEGLTKMKVELENYEKSPNKDFYETPEFKVEFSDGLLNYHFKTLYLTVPGAVHRECFEIDPTINFITLTNENYEKRVGIIKINHPDSTKLLLKAIENCMRYVKMLNEAF